MVVVWVKKTKILATFEPEKLLRNGRKQTFSIFNKRGVSFRGRSEGYAYMVVVWDRKTKFFTYFLNPKSYYVRVEKRLFRFLTMRGVAFGGGSEGYEYVVGI